MPTTKFTRTSLYTTLGIIVVTMVLVILAIHGVYSYYTTKRSIIAEMRLASNQSIASLQVDISNLMAAYSVNEYDKLVYSEMERHDYLAIVVDDYNLGEVLGSGAAKIGKIRGPNRQIVDYDADNPSHKEWIAASFSQNRYTITSQSGKTLGTINIYMSDRQIIRQLDTIVRNAAINAATLSTLLIITLFFGIRRFILRPLDTIDQAIRNCDLDGIPLAMIPVHGPREIVNLSKTMNDMIVAIQNSKKTLTEQNERLVQHEGALRQSEARLEAILDNVVEGIVTVDLAGQIMYANPGALQILDMRKDKILGRYFQDSEWHHVDEMGATFPAEKLPLAIVLSDLRPVQNFEHGIIDSTGTQRWLSVNAAPLFNERRELIGGVASFRDMTERQKTEFKLKQFKKALETTHDGFWIVDSGGFLQEVNYAYAEIVGYKVDELIGMHISRLEANEVSASEVAAHVEKLKQNQHETFETRHRHKDGRMIDVEISASYEPTSGNFVTFCRNISDRKAAEKQITNLAFYDPLTALPNRRLLQDRMSQAVAYNRRYQKNSALLFIDLDDFKSINDTLGHEIGDQLLQQAAQRLQSCMRAGDTIARSGGDEFVAVLQDLGTESSEAAAQAGAAGYKILDVLSQPYHVSGHVCLSSSSIGIAVFGTNQNVLGDLLKQADIAMYEAKKSGGHCLRFFEPEMQASIDSHVALERALQTALDQKEFQLYFQVQVGRNNNPVGAEALIRWNNPERGLVSPAQFIPMAETSEQIVKIGTWVLESACEQLKAWQKDAIACEFTLAINVSAKQFRQTDFVPLVRDAIARHQVDPRLLKLELTESVLLEDIDSSIRSMEELKMIGVQLSLDDFGTGYSSLQYLKHLPIDQIKIDQSFVRDIVKSGSDKAIVRTIVALAKNLNLEAIAEGVETEEQRQSLLNKGCVYFQGYLFGKPMPIENFESAVLCGIPRS